MSTAVLKYDATTATKWAEEIAARSGQNLKACYQCRKCAAGCPVGEETGVTPDRLIRLILLGDRQAAVNNLLVWKCLACYTCGTRCPNGIQTARITETLKQMAKRDHVKPLTPRIADFHASFMTATRHFGRFNELECMAMYEAKTALKDLAKGDVKAVIGEMSGQIKLGSQMMKKKRMHFKLDKVRANAEVKALYEKATARSEK